MKKYLFRFTPEARRLISHLHPENKRQIKKALGELQQDPYPGKDLQEGLSGYKSLRIKKYRVLYNINVKEKIIQILYICLRGDVYEQFRYLLAELKNFSSTIK